MDQLPCLDLYDKAALKIFKEWGIDPDGPVEDDCINPVYRFSPKIQNQIRQKLFEFLAIWQLMQ